jgi:hypothetical protein
MSENKTLAQKLLEVQKSIGAAVKDANNPFFKSTYADLNQILSLAKESLNPLGLIILQGPGISDAGHRYIETSIIDADSGQQVYTRVPLSGNEKNMQEIGAATTYGRRIGLKSLLAMEEIDDDGETAVGRGKNEPKRESKSGKSTQAESKPSVASTAVLDAGRASSAASAGVSTELKSTLPRDVINKQISAYAKVALDKKLMSQEQLVGLLKQFGASKKEDLKDEQANEVLAKLKGVVNS